MQNLIQIGYASKQDLDNLSKIITTVIFNIPYYNDLAKRHEIEKFSPENLEEKLSMDKYSVMIARVDDEIAAFCLSRFDDYLIWLEWFGIVEDQRGKGISNQLLKELDKTASFRQCHKIWCDCRTTNKASIHILKSHNYQQLVTISNHWYNQDFIIWEKRM